MGQAVFLVLGGDLGDFYVFPVCTGVGVASVFPVCTVVGVASAASPLPCKRRVFCVLWRSYVYAFLHVRLSFCPFVPGVFLGFAEFSTGCCVL